MSFDSYPAQMQSALLLNNTPGSWKLIDQVHTNLFKLELPLPENPLRSVNCYLVKGTGRFLLIDTGMNRKECLEEVHGDLRKLRVDVEKTDFFITHLHADHIGLVSKLAGDSGKLRYNPPVPGKMPLTPRPAFLPEGS
ncbi:MAG: hypothetical protein DRH11_12905 [Deltaproteobacteria bacterium]|nr:MAG: hypothetical protein DRH11_12905 [Deltaproteobacteria bacterium]